MEEIDIERLRALARRRVPKRYAAAMLGIDEELLNSGEYASLYDMEYNDDDADTSTFDDNSTDSEARAKAMRLRYSYRRAYSEIELMQALGTNGFSFSEGESYILLTNGDIDSLSYLKAVLRQQTVHHLILSTWKMNYNDIMKIRGWCDDGSIERMDCYLGMLFRKAYIKEFHALKGIYDAHDGFGRIVITNNHSKVLAGYGDRFAFAILSSANMNTNPRIENTCIYIGMEAYQFCRTFFDDIKF